MKNKIINLLKFLFFFSIGFIILYLVYQKQNAAFIEQCRMDGTPMDECSLILKVVNDFKSVNFFWIFMIIFAFLISNISRMIRWNMLIKPLGYTPRKLNSFLTIMLGYFTNLGFPRLGEIVRAGTLAKYEKIPPGKVMGTVATDRVFDVISLAIVIGLAFIFEYDTLYTYIKENWTNSDTTGTGIFTFNSLFILTGILVFFLGLFWLFRKKIMNSGFYKKIIEFILGFWEGIKTVGKLEKTGLFVFHSVVIWIMYFLMTYFGCIAFAPTAHLSLNAALLIFVFGSLGIVIPSPGGMGTYHFLIIAALALYGISGDDSFSFANILFFSVQLGANILFGIIALILLPIINKKTISISEKQTIEKI